MAQFNVVGIDGIISEMNRRTEKAVKKIPKMLEAGAAVLVEAQKAEVDAMVAMGLYHKKDASTRVYSPRSLGDLKKSIKATKVKTDKSGFEYVDVYPQGKDSKGIRNADKGFTIEFGRSNTNAYHWMENANAKAAEEVSAAMHRVWEDDSDG